MASDGEKVKALLEEHGINIVPDSHLLWACLKAYRLGLDDGRLAECRERGHLAYCTVVRCGCRNDVCTCGHDKRVKELGGE